MNCKQCGNAIAEDKREDTLFCDQNCKQKHYKRRKKISKEIESLSKAILREKDVIDHWQRKIEEEKKERLERSKKLEEIISRKTKNLNFGRRVLSKNWEEFCDYIIDLYTSSPDKYWRELEIMEYGSEEELFRLLASKQRWYKETNRRLETELQQLKSKLLKNNFNLIIDDESSIQKKAEKVIEKCKAEIKTFEDRLDELKQIDIDRLPIIPSKKTTPNKAKRISNARAYSSTEIAGLNFEVVQLKGQLGYFLGKLERNKCAIALTGDSGAGKSTFSFSITNGFLNLGQSVGYFTLESGFTNKFKEFSSKHKGNTNFKAFEEGTLKDVRTEANNFDCIVIDSYSKISQKAADFEDLRQDFPDTFFIIIFQKTTDGKIRGGSSILFNSTATIDVQVDEDGERIAVMKKSRYDTENFIYSISRDEILKWNKLPI